MGIAAALALASFSGRKTAPRGVSPGEVSLRRLTFRRGNVLKARFAPDGRTVVYGAAWDGKPAELFSVRTDSLESRPLGVPNADILSVSSKGELAILMKRGFLSTTVGSGTLARVPLGGGAPREIAEGVLSADWSPDGSDLAVIREWTGGKCRLEYPIGKTLYETTGDLGGVRVSRNDKGVAVTEYEGSAGLFVVVSDGAGKVRKLSGPWNYVESLVWRPAGSAVIFGAGSSQTHAAIREVTLTGRQRVVYPAGENLILDDLDRDGRLLVEREVPRWGIVMRPPGEDREREMS